MPTWNSRGLRGSVLEDLINRTNEMYREKGLALIQKVPTPITPIKIDKEQCDVLCDEIHRVKEGGKMADVKPEVKALCEELSGFKYEDCFAHNNVGFQDGSVTPAE